MVNMFKFKKSKLLTENSSTNSKVRQKIKDEEVVKNDLLRELRKAENDQNVGMSDN